MYYVLQDPFLIFLRSRGVWVQDYIASSSAGAPQLHPLVTKVGCHYCSPTPPNIPLP